ncbi:MAG: hypothetical protein J5985_03000 [Kiritimatiellae bacterium]|nr:hypothetical protein [Kiritimatiellia bacterium]
MDWRNELNGIMNGRGRMTRAEQENAQFEEFLTTVAMPALQEIAEELRKHNRDAQVRTAPASVKLQVLSGEVEEITFSVMKQYVQTGILPKAEVRLNKGTGPLKYESMFRDDPQNYPITEVTKDDVIACFLKFYRQAMSDRP